MSATMEFSRSLYDVVKGKDLYSHFDRSAMEKGHRYQAQGRVTAVEISEDLTHISGNVRGSQPYPYRVDIALEFDRNGRLAELDATCTCPVGVNCKHAVATMFQALSGKGVSVEARAKRDAEVGKAPAPVLSADVTEWLDTIGGAARGDDYPASQTQRLLYCLQPDEQGARMPVLSVSLLSAHVRKDGSFGGSTTSPSLFDFSPERAPKYFRESDIEIAAQLSKGLASYDYHPRRRPRSLELLQRIVATGRAFWRDYKRRPIQWGEPREGRIEWLQAGKRGLSPQLTVPGVTALNGEPPVYVDEAAGVIGLADVGLSSRLAYQLLAAPVIPRAQAAEVARRLGQKVPELHHGLLPGTPASAVKIDEDPVPVLRLKRGREVPNAYYYYADKRDRTAAPTAVAHLSVRYGPVEIEPTERATALEVFQAGEVYTIARRRAKEKAAGNRLAELGFAQARSVNPYLDFGAHVHDMALKTPHDWFEFLDAGVAKLRDEGFEVLIDDDFPYLLADSSGEFDAELESSGMDWFELALGIEIDGERRDLAPLLAALVASPDFTPDQIKQLAEQGDNFYLPLADGRHLSLAADRFLPLVLALHGLRLSGAFGSPSEKIRLSRADVLPLLAHENQEFAFRGADNLRRLASLLQGREASALVLPEGFRAELRPYQAQGVRWLDMLRESGLGGVLADDMGLGKTVQLLALLSLEKARGHLTEPALVVAPTSLMTNWASEAQKFAPDLKVLVLHGADRKHSFDAIGAHDLVLTTYPLIARDHEILLSREWHIAVLDEAQTIKNPNAATTRWLRGIKARHRFCLTGTPVENHLGELWSIMSFANPGYLGDKTEFGRRWRTSIEKRGDMVRAAALAQRVKPFLLRRTKAEVVTELPPKSEIVERIALEGSQRDIYDSIRLSMADKVRKAIEQRGLAKSHIVVLEALLRLRQACCDPALLKLDDRVQRPAAKLDRLMEMVEELLSEGRKIIVFSQFTSMIDRIKPRFDAGGVRYSVLTGETTNRKAAIEAFQSGDRDVFLISLKAGGVGLNLTAADTVVIFDPWWNPAVEEQAIDRAHRIGQDKPVFVYRMMASGTIEEKMDELKARKRLLADSLFDREGRIGSALTEEDVRALFEE